MATKTWRSASPRQGVRLAAIGVVAAGAAALAGCGGGETAATGAGAGSVAGFIPAGAPVYAEVSTDVDTTQWRQALALARRFPAYDEFIAEAVADLGKEGVDFDRDIRPLLGESAAIALPEIPTQAGRNDDPPVLVALSVGEGKEAQLVGLLTKGGGLKATGRVHRGAQIYADGDDMFLAVADGAAVIASTEALLTRALDAHAGGSGATMAGSARLREALAELPDEVLAQGFVDVGAVTRAAAAKGGEAVGKQLEASGIGPDAAVAMSVSAESTGVRVKAVGLGVGGAAQSEEFTPKLVQDVPAGALAYVGFANAAKTFEGSYRRMAAQDPDVKKGVESLRGLLALVDVSVDDLKTLTSGEHALIVTPGDIPGIVAALAVQDGTAAAGILDRLRERIGVFAPKDKLPPFERVALANGVTGWQSKVAPTGSVVYGVDGDVALVGSQVDAVRQVQSAAARLADDAAFRAATAQMPAKVGQVVWLNGQGIVNAIDAAGGFKKTPEKAKANLRPVKNVAGWSTVGEKPTFEAFVTIR